MNKKLLISLFFSLLITSPILSNINFQKSNYAPWQKKIRSYSLISRKKIDTVTNFANKFTQEYKYEIASFAIAALCAHYIIPVTTVEQAREAAQKTLDYSYTGIRGYIWYPFKPFFNYFAQQTLDLNDHNLKNYLLGKKYYNVLRGGCFGINLFKLLKAFKSNDYTYFDTSHDEVKKINTILNHFKNEIEKGNWHLEFRTDQ